MTRRTVPGQSGHTLYCPWPITIHSILVSLSLNLCISEQYNEVSGVWPHICHLSLFERTVTCASTHAHAHTQKTHNRSSSASFINTRLFSINYKCLCSSVHFGIYCFTFNTLYQAKIITESLIALRWWFRNFIYLTKL